MKMKIISLFMGILGFHLSAHSDVRFKDSADYFFDLDRGSSPKTNFEISDVKIKLKFKEGFTQVCPDSFCNGDHSSVVLLDLMFVVDVKKEQIVKVAMVFAGSRTEINETTGEIDYSTKITKCEKSISLSIREYLELEKASNADDQFNVFTDFVIRGDSALSDIAAEECF